MTATIGWRESRFLAISNLPKGQAKEKFTIDSKVAQVRQALVPLDQSLAFLPGHRYEDANAQTPRNLLALGALLAVMRKPKTRRTKRAED